MLSINDIYSEILSENAHETETCSCDDSSDDSTDESSSASSSSEVTKHKINAYRRILDSERTYFGSDVNRDTSSLTSDMGIYNCCLFMIVRNESKIIKRCLDGVKELIDAVCICDTGSNDNTAGLIREWGLENNVNTTVYEPTGTGLFDDTDWRTFCYNRTQSFVLARGTYPKAKYYMTIDADMLIRIDKPIDWDSLNLAGYTLNQTSSAFTYSNVRIVNNEEWKSEDYTHEAWCCPRGIPGRLNDVWIDDYNDGGCKGDKPHRDICFELCQIIQNRYSGRQYFYLAQTFSDMGDYDMGIYWYLKRYEEGGWDQEQWLALFNVGKCYLNKHLYKSTEYWPHNYDSVDNYDYIIDGERCRPGWDIIDLDKFESIRNTQDCESTAVKYLLEAYNIRPWRAEPLMKLCTYYRDISK